MEEEKTKKGAQTQNCGKKQGTLANKKVEKDKKDEKEMWAKLKELIHLATKCYDVSLYVPATWQLRFK